MNKTNQILLCILYAIILIIPIYMLSTNHDPVHNWVRVINLIYFGTMLVSILADQFYSKFTRNFALVGGGVVLTSNILWSLGII